MRDPRKPKAGEKLYDLRGSTYVVVAVVEDERAFGGWIVVVRTWWPRKRRHHWEIWDAIRLMVEENSGHDHRDVTCARANRQRWKVG